MWNKPTPQELSSLPKIGHYQNTQIPDIQISQHYFLGSADWWISEYDPTNRIMYGYACLGDQQLAEWGSISFDELTNLSINPHYSAFPIEVDRDLYWEPKPVHEVAGIVACYNAQGLNELVTKR